MCKIVKFPVMKKWNFLKRGKKALFRTRIAKCEYCQGTDFEIEHSRYGLYPRCSYCGTIFNDVIVIKDERGI